jgi:hypothetical protein
VYMSLLMCASAVAGLIASVPSAADMAERMRGEEIHAIQQALEKQIVAEKLTAYGLSAAEVNTKLQSMSDRQIHLLSQASDRVLAGGDGIGLVIGVLIIVLLVVLILKLSGKKVIVT